MTRAIQILAVLLLAAATAQGQTPPEAALDPVTGMKIAENWELVRNHCIICHSAHQFLRQTGTRSNWESMIRWMQKEQGLWKFDPVTEDKILTYLSENYPPGDSYRRAPIPATLMPPNPYVSAAKREFEAQKAQGKIPSGPPKAP